MNSHQFQHDSARLCPKFKWSSCIVLLAALGGCAGVEVDPAPDYDVVQEKVATATGSTGLFRPGEEEEVAGLVADLLKDGLTVDESVQISLLNNGDLQALLYEIGMRRADAVQAGLLSNPTLGALVLFPFDGGSTATEVGLLQNIIEFWQLSPRKRLAQGQLERTILEVAHDAAGLAIEARTAYFHAYSASMGLTAAQENHAAARKFLDFTLERQEAGAATQVDVNAARSQFLEQENLIRRAQFTASDTKRDLLLVLGIY